MCLVNGKGRFLTPRSSEIWRATELKLKTKKRVLGATPHAKYGYDRIRTKGVGGANSQFVTSLVLPFVSFFVYFSNFTLCTGRTARPIATLNGLYDAVSAKEVPIGGLSYSYSYSYN